MLMSNDSRTRSSGMSTMAPPSMTAALRTSTSTSKAPAWRRSISSRRLSLMAVRVRPASSASARRLRTRGQLSAAAMTSWPAFASARALPSPNPLLAPVIRIFLGMGAFLLCIQRDSCLVDRFSRVAGDSSSCDRSSVVYGPLRWRYNGAMPSVQIKDVPDEVHAVLRQRAAAAGQSLQEYLLGRLVADASRPTLDEVLE